MKRRAITASVAILAGLFLFASAPTSQGQGEADNPKRIFQDRNSRQSAPPPAREEPTIPRRARHRQPPALIELVETVNFPDQMAEEFIESSRNYGVRRIAVTDFVPLDQNSNTEKLAEISAEKLFSQLNRSASFEDVERFEFEGDSHPELLTNREKILELGAKLNVDAVCIGKIADLGKSVEVFVYLYLSAGGSVVYSYSAEIAKPEREL